MAQPGHETERPVTVLERIELEHIDAEGREDNKRAAALGTETDLGASYLLNFRLFGSLCSISLAAITAYWGFSPPAAVLTFIAEDIGTSGGNESLFSIVWTMCAAVTMLLLGRLSDKFGRRPFVLSATVISIVGAIIAATAKTMNALIGANVLLGLAAGIQSCYALLVGEIVPNKYKWLGIMVVIVPSLIPSGFGAYLARMLVENSSWRWIYYIQIILMTCALGLQIIFYKPPNFKQLHGQRSFRRELMRVDYVGIFLLVSGLSMFLLGVSWGGQPTPWKSAKIISLIVVGGCLLLLLCFWDVYSKTPNPIIPVRAWKDLRGFAPLACISEAAGAMYVAPVIIWPAQVVRVYGSHFTGWKAEAWTTTTIAFGLTSGMLFFGFFFHIMKRIKYQLLFEAVLSTTFIGALASCGRNDLSAAIAFSTIGSFPVGAMEVTPQVVVQVDSPDGEIGVFYAFMNAFRTACGAVFTAVFLAILNSKTGPKIAEMVPPAAVAAGLPRSSLTALTNALAQGTGSALASVPGMTESIELAVNNALADAYSAAYAYVYYAAIAVGCIAIISALVLRDYDDRMTNHVAKQMYHGDRNIDVLATNEKEPVEHTEEGA
ncbi:fungal trichothecene efflux pump [Exophiala viscosa]|uniref:Fungal trichothecene efflux pump n=1 Tax=Exophiala viscosa TaxID=2486360 RepID=A0AAN6DWV7_9EURO|nr:fungal trichothecene efflux pump [Exophiala viscosa]